MATMTNTTTTTQPSEAEIERMRALVAQADQVKAAKAAADREAHLAPLRAAIASDEWKTTLATVNTLRARYAGDPQIAPHIDAIGVIMARLAEIVPIIAAAPLAPPLPAATV